jgi:hypothetical protein
MSTSVDDHIIRKTICGKWFAGKRYIDLLAVSNKSEPLGFAERLVCSFVVWLDRIKPGEGKPLSAIARRLHLGRRQVREAAKALEKKGLVRRVIVRANATLLLPTGKHLDQYFVMKSDRLLSNRLYLLDDGATITIRDAALLSVLFSIAAARNSLFITNRKNGLAALASISRSQVDVSLERLKKAGAGVVGANQLALKQPSAEFMGNFPDTGKRKREVERGQLFSITAVGAENEGFAREVNEVIARWQEEQLNSGWRLIDCQDYWKEMIFYPGSDKAICREFLLIHFPALWITAQEQHAETGRAKTCRHLLTSLSKQAIETTISGRRTL